jgi:hypothetical protein
VTRTGPNPVYRRTPAEERFVERMNRAPPYTVLRPTEAPVAQPGVPPDCWFVSTVDGRSGAYDDAVMAEVTRRGIDVVYADGLALEPERDDELECFEGDAEAVIYALHAGFSVVKLPDTPSSPYYRWHFVRPWPRGSRFPLPNPDERRGVASGRTFKLGGVPYRLPDAISVQWAPANQAWLVLWNDQVLRVISDREELRDYLRNLGARTINPKEGLLSW